MISESSLKVPGGKLLQVKVDFEGDIINSISFYGDFFLHPEESITVLEKMLVNVRIAEVDNILKEFFSGDVQAYGVDEASFNNVIRGALK